jgi:hypothetical protein
LWRLEIKDRGALLHMGASRCFSRDRPSVTGLCAFRQGRDIIIKLKAAAPSNVTLPRDT